MLILNADEVRRALPMAETIEVMKRAYEALADGRAQVPLRTRLSIDAHNAISLIMPAYADAGGDEALAIKVVSIYPKNPGRGMALIQAAVLLLEAESGKALALLQGGALTAIRTGAASGAAADVLARRDSNVAAIIGAGVQARTQLEAVCSVRRIETVWVFDHTPDKASRFAAEMAEQGPIPRDIRAADDAGQAVRAADIICTATTSAAPVFADDDLQPGTHICAVGSYTPEMQEVPAESIRRARVVVDSRPAVLAEAGDLIQPLLAGLFGEDHIHAELGEILLGRRPGRESDVQITYFKSVGLAVQDAVAARLAFANAQKQGFGQPVSF